MHRTQIALGPEQYRRLGQEARRLGISASVLVRRLIDAHLGTPTPENEDPLAATTGIGHGGGEPIGRDHDRILYGNERQ